MKFKGQVLATDLDGTLFFPKNRLNMMSRSNLKFLRKFSDEGGRIAIVSGRNKYFNDKVARKLKRPVDSLGCNSSFIEVDGKRIKEAPMDNNRLSYIINEIKKNYKVRGVLLMTKEYNLIIPVKEFWLPHRIGYHIYFFFEGTYREPNVMSDRLIHEQIEHGCVYKAMLWFGVSKKSKLRAMEANKEMRLLYPDFEFSWCGQMIEVTKRGNSKAEGLRTYLDYLKINDNNIMVVGDSGNDISMFTAFRHSFCMEHAPLAVSKYASHIVRKVADVEKYMNKLGGEN